MTTNGDPSGGTPPPSNAAPTSGGGNLPTIPEITLHREIARGGMGIVYRGRQDFLERDVAVKLLSPHLQGERFAARFRREAKLLAGIKHPHIVACYAAGVTPTGQHYLVMELVEGPNLAQWIARNGPVPVRSALRIVRQLASALGQACDLGVIHRDVKTPNILLEAPSGTMIDPLFPFVPKLVDLGLARMVDAAGTDPAQTMAGAVMGTPSTMAPEQFDAPDAVDFRADIYGLGCVLYEMLTGAPAFAAQRLTDLVVAKRQPRGPNPCERGARIPAPIGQLVASMLAQDPKDRPADYRALRARLDELAKGPIDAPQPAADAPRAPGPNLLQTAEFEFLAAGRDGAPGAGGAQFVSRVEAPVEQRVEPPAKATPTSAPPPPPAPRRPAPAKAPTPVKAPAPARAPAPAKLSAPAKPLAPAPFEAAWPAPAKPFAPAFEPAWEPAPPNAFAPANAAAPAAHARPRVAGVQPIAAAPQRRRHWLVAGAAATVLVLAAVPLLRRHSDAVEPAPQAHPSPTPATTAPTPTAENSRPQVELLGLDGELRRGTRVLLRSQAVDPAGGELHYAWSVQPAGAATLSTPNDASTALRHDLLPGDEFTLALAVSGARGSTVVERHTTVHYEPENLLVNFLGTDSGWQPPNRMRAAWRQRDDGAVWAAADELPCLRTHTLTGSIWRLGGKLLSERGDARRASHEGFAQAAVCVRLTAQRQLAIVCMRDGTNGERWSLSLEEVVRDESRGVFALRPLLDGSKDTTNVDAINPIGGATFTITRRGSDLHFEFGFAGRDEHGAHTETVRGDDDDLSLTLFARGGRALFPELLLW
jgi:serine/threonine-protein kinase